MLLSPELIDSYESEGYENRIVGQYESKQPVMLDGYHKVKVGERLDYNKKFKK